MGAQPLPSYVGPQPLPSYVAGAICGSRLKNSEFQVLNFYTNFSDGTDQSSGSVHNMQKSTVQIQISHFKFTILSYLVHLCTSIPILHSGGRRECTHSPCSKTYLINFNRIYHMLIQPSLFTVTPLHYTTHISLYIYSSNIMQQIILAT